MTRGTSSFFVPIAVGSPTDPRHEPGQPAMGRLPGSMESSSSSAAARPATHHYLGGTGRLRVAITPDGKRAPTSPMCSPTASVIDTTTNMVVGPSPIEVAVAPDGKHVYVTVTTRPRTRWSLRRRSPSPETGNTPTSRTTRPPTWSWRRFRLGMTPRGGGADSRNGSCLHDLVCIRG
jgi:hypothetical protein